MARSVPAPLATRWPEAGPDTALATVEDPRLAAARTGALAAGVPALALATLGAATAPLLAPLLSAVNAALPPLMGAALGDGLLMLGSVLLALPAALLARMAVSAQSDDPDQAQATAAGAGAATTLVAISAALLHAGGPAVALRSGVGFVGAFLAVATVGLAAFSAIPGRLLASRTALPGLYAGMGAAGTTALALTLAAGVADSAALAFPLLDAPRMWLFMALPHPLGDLASFAVVLGSLAPVTGLAARMLRTVGGPRVVPAVAAGVALTVLSPAVSCLALALLQAGTNAGIAANYLALAVGGLLGALPHILALAWGLRSPSTSGDRLPELTD